MHRPFLERLRLDTHLAFRIARRDRARRLLLGALILVVLAYAGREVQAIFLAIAILALEGAGWGLTGAEPEQIDDLRLPHVIFACLVNMFATVAYLWAGVVLAGHPSLVLMLAGVLLIFAMLIRISNTFQPISLAGWAQLLPAFLVTIHAFRVVQSTRSTGSDGVEWLVIWGLVALYGVNAVQSLLRQSDTRRALDLARSVALRRLQALEDAAQRDSLTGLSTRDAFERGLADLLARPHRGRTTAVLFLDIDNFKLINDQNSHAAGDMVLATLGRRLMRVLPPQTLTARVGGDEFVVALGEVSSPREVMRIAREVRQAVGGLIRWDGRTLQVSASIGIAFARPGLQSAAWMIDAADRAMYRAKSRARGAIAFHNPIRSGPPAQAPEP